MRTLAIVPIKSFDSAKQRLAAVLATGSRRSLVQAMFSDVLAALRRAQGIDQIAVVTDDVAAESIARGDGVLTLRDEHPSGQSDAAAIGVRHAEAYRFERALLVPGDTPLLVPDEVTALLERTAAAGVGVAIVPDRHGTGTNGLLLSPPDIIEPAFGPGSRARHEQLARSAGARCTVDARTAFEYDVDTVDDLDAVDDVRAA